MRTSASATPPPKGVIYGIDIRQRSTLRAFRQSIFTNTLEGAHEFGDGWKLNWLGNYTGSKDDRSVVGEASWDSPSTRTLRPTVAYDFSDPNRSRLNLFTTVQLASPTRYQAGTAVTAIDTFTKPLSSLTVLDAVDTTQGLSDQARRRPRDGFPGRGRHDQTRLPVRSAHQDRQ